MNGSFKNRKVNFSMIPNSVLQGDMSLRAKGLYGMIFSYISIPDFTLYKKYLIKKSNLGDDAFQNVWNELKSKGYLLQERCQDDTGKFDWRYELLDEPAIPRKTTPWITIGMDSHGMENRGHINNTNQKILNNNTYPSILSIDGKSETLAESFKENIEYQVLCEGMAEEKKELYDSIIHIAENALKSENKQYRINNHFIADSEIKSRLLTLNQFHIDYVYRCIIENKSKIKNPQNYILACLYNAPAAMPVHTQNLINNL